MITEGLASLRELKTAYTLEEVLDMYEAVMVKRSNEYLAAKAATKGKG